MEEKIQSLIEKSKQVIGGCVLENGAIVAANPVKDYYSKEAKHYFYVWPRDGAYTCIAADTIGNHDIQENFFHWIENHAEGFEETGLLYEKYYVNGLQALNRFQPDQGAMVLNAIEFHIERTGKPIIKFKKMISKLADAICEQWDEDHFKIVTNDLWEERHTFPDLVENFSYSLAACIKGLNAANNLIGGDNYIEVADQMKKALLESAKKSGYFFRSFGKLNDERIDASMLGIIWPFEVITPEDEKAQKTLSVILDKIVKNDGLYRYEQDEYDGWMYRTMHRKKGAGYWPLLNFWLAITLNKMGRREEGLKYYKKVLDEIGEDGLIPEQIFTNDIQKAVSPLCWSHAMFILASKELGLVK